MRIYRSMAITVIVNDEMMYEAVNIIPLIEQMVLPLVFSVMNQLVQTIRQTINETPNIMSLIHWPTIRTNVALCSLGLRLTVKQTNALPTKAKTAIIEDVNTIGTTDPIF